MSQKSFRRAIDARFLLYRFYKNISYDSSMSNQFSLLIDDFQPVALVLVQGHQDANAIVQIGHQLLVVASGSNCGGRNALENGSTNKKKGDATLSKHEASALNLFWPKRNLLAKSQQPVGKFKIHITVGDRENKHTLCKMDFCISNKGIIYFIFLVFISVTN